jgi:hypothetical protein
VWVRPEQVMRKYFDWAQNLSNYCENANIRTCPNSCLLKETNEWIGWVIRLLSFIIWENYS